jgi:hypothetical protein
MLKLIDATYPKSELFFQNGSTLKWWTDLGFGYLSTPTLIDYGQDYWDNYVKMRGNGIGEKLTAGRVDLASRVIKAMAGSGYELSDFVDVGIGSGEFVEAAKCLGSDINPHAISWLQDRGRFVDLTTKKPDLLTMWDVLEHIPDPSLHLRAQVIITSLPIHKDAASCIASKHFKPGEHIWQFTDQGIKNFMRLAGHECRYSDDFETRAGREGIGSYVFSRININLETC